MKPPRWLVAALLAAGCGGVVQGSAPPLAPTGLPLGAAILPVAIPAPEGEGPALRALLVLPAEPSRRPIVALHGCGGLGAPEQPMRLFSRERDWAGRLAAAGHPILFPDSFGSRGLGEACGVDRFPAGPFGPRARDALAAADWAAAQPWASGFGAPALLGWSHGGSTILGARAIAKPGQIAGAVALYPGCLRAPKGASQGGAAPLLLLLGERDDWTPPRFCDAWAASDPAVRRITYAEAEHGFDGLAEGRRARVLPNLRTVHVGGQARAREDAHGQAIGFLQALP